MPADTDLIKVVIDDHRVVEDVFKELEEHAEAEETMRQLDGLDPTDHPRFEEYLTRLIGDIRRHVEEEESGKMAPA